MREAWPDVLFVSSLLLTVWPSVRSTGRSSLSFDPQQYDRAVVPEYSAPGVDGNAKSTDCYPLFVHGQLTKLLMDGIISESDLGITPEADPSVTYSALGVAIAKSKKQLARVIGGGFAIRDDVSLARANAALEVVGLPAVKPRLIFDLTQSGKNRNYVRPPIPLSYICIDDVVQTVEPGDYMAVTDARAYFLQFPLPWYLRGEYRFRYGGKVYEWNRTPFGLSPLSYFTSAVTAELCSIMRARGAPAIAMVDDFFIRGPTRVACARNLAVAKDTLHGAGFVTVDAMEFEDGDT